MRYAGFWSRLKSGVIDFLLFIPFVGIYFWIQDYSRIFTIIYWVPFGLLYAAYNIYFHGRFGKTPGKMIVGVRVVRLDGTSIGFRQAIYRHGVDLILGMLATISAIMALINITDAQYYGASGFIQRSGLIEAAKPSWGGGIDFLENIWVWSELIVLLFNKKRRAIHDFIAGTVVIYGNKPTQIIVDKDAVEKKSIRTGAVASIVVFLITLWLAYKSDLHNFSLLIAAVIAYFYAKLVATAVKRLNQGSDSGVG